MILVGPFIGVGRLILISDFLGADHTVVQTNRLARASGPSRKSTRSSSHWNFCNNGRDRRQRRLPVTRVKPNEILEKGANLNRVPHRRSADHRGQRTPPTRWQRSQSKARCRAWSLLLPGVIITGRAPQVSLTHEREHHQALMASPSRQSRSSIRPETFLDSKWSWQRSRAVRKTTRRLNQGHLHRRAR